MLISLLLALAAPQSVGENAEGQPLDARQLEALVRRVESFKGRDQFSLPPDQSNMIGRRFVVDIPMHTDRVPGWRYDAAAQKLKIDMGPTFTFKSSALPKEFREAVQSNGGDGYSFFDNVSSRSDYPAANAFGVVAMVKSKMGRSYGLVPVSGSKSASPDWESEVSLPVNTARTITPRLRVRIEGRIKEVDASRAVACFDDYMAPTLSSPREEITRKCLVGVQIERVSVVDSATGTALKEWSAD